jgi:hypothetical protein
MWANDLPSKLSTLGTSALWKMVCPTQWPPISPDLTPLMEGLLSTMSITHHNGLPKTVHDVKIKCWSSFNIALTLIEPLQALTFVISFSVNFIIFHNTSFCWFLWWFGFLDCILNVHNVINVYGCKYYFRGLVLAETKFMLQVLRQLREYGHKKLYRLLGTTLQYTY